MKHEKMEELGYVCRVSISDVEAQVTDHPALSKNYWENRTQKVYPPKMKSIKVPFYFTDKIFK